MQEQSLYHCAYAQTGVSWSRCRALGRFWALVREPRWPEILPVHGLESRCENQ